MPVTDLELSGLFGTRESAEDVIARAELPRDMSGVPVTLYCRDMLSGSTSFADQLVDTLLVKRGARGVVVVGAPERFRKHMLDAAKRRGMVGKIRIESAARLVG